MKKRYFLPGLIAGALMLATALSSCSNLIVDLRAKPASFGTSYMVLPAGTDGTAGTSGTYVQFGDWPQTIKAADVTVDENESITRGAFTYYKGSDGAWYAKCTENAWGDDYTYSDGTEVAKLDADSTKYFKVEPIKWRVLTDDYSGKKLLLAENMLINSAFYDYNRVERTIGGSSVLTNNYKESRVRAYLNGLSYEKKESDSAEQVNDSSFVGKGFLQTAFSDALQSQIVTTTVDNSSRSTCPDEYDSTAPEWNNGVNPYACENTSDKIFLLSTREATTTVYGFTDYGEQGTTRIRMATDFSKANGSVPSTWWLRSPRYDEWNDDCARKVWSNGDIDYESEECSGIGLVPALCIESSGSGSSTEPETTIAVTGVSLDKTTTQTVTVGNSISFTATVAPDNATDKTVKWSVSGTGITLYSDSECTTAITTGTATNTLTVYAKGTAAGNATVTMTSNADSTKTATCAMHVKEPATGHALSASEVGEVVGIDGLAYAVTDKDNLPTGVSAAGMVAYKNGTNGLVIALTDEANWMNYSTANGASGAAAHMPTVTGYSWKQTSVDEFKQMFEANGGSQTDCSGLNTVIRNAGGTGLNVNDAYWTSTWISGQVNPYIMETYSPVRFRDTPDHFTNSVRACLEF